MATTMDKVARVTWIMYLMGFVDLFAVSMFIPLLSNHIRSLGLSLTLAGLIGSIYGSIQLFSSPFIGQWSDVRGRKFVLLRCMLFTTIGYALSAFSYIFIILLLSRLIPGLFKHSQEIAKSYLADVTSKEKQAAVFGRFNAISGAGFIVGPLVGGHIAELSGGFYLLSVFASILFFINTVFVWWCVPDEHELGLSRTKSQKQLDATAPTSTWISSLTSPFHTISHIDWSEQWDLFACRFLFSLAVMVYRSNFSLVMQERYDARPSYIGYIISFGGISATISGIVVGRMSEWYEHRYARLYRHSAALQVLSLACVTYAPNLTILILSIPSLSLSNAIGRVTLVKLTLERSGHKTETGTLLGLGASVQSLSRVVSPTLAGVAAEFSLTGPGVLAVGLALVGTSILYTTKHKEYTAGGTSNEMEQQGTRRVVTFADDKKEL